MTFYGEKRMSYRLTMWVLILRIIIFMYVCVYDGMKKYKTQSGDIQLFTKTLTTTSTVVVPFSVDTMACITPPE